MIYNWRELYKHCVLGAFFTPKFQAVRHGKGAPLLKFSENTYIYVSLGDLPVDKKARGISVRDRKRFVVFYDLIDLILVFGTS